MTNQNNQNIVVYNDGELELKVPVNGETIWLSQSQISEVFETSVDSVKRTIKHYNFDAIISVGYRVSSIKATKFRQWATTVLKNYIQNGYAINQHKINELRLSSLENDVATIKSHIKNNSLELRHGIFFNGQIFDAYIFVSDLIKSAKKSITLIDNYSGDILRRL